MRKHNLYNLVKPYFFRLFVITILALVIMGIGIYLPLINRMLIDDAIIKKEIGLFWRLIIGYSILTLLSMVFGSVNQYFITKLSELILKDLRANLFKAFYSMKYLVADQMNSGEVLNRILVEAADIVPLITSIYINVLIQGLSLIVTIVIIFYLNVTIGIAALVLLPLIFIMLKFVNPKLVKFNTEVVERHTEISTTLQESIASHKSIRYHLAYQFVNDRFIKKISDYVDIKLRFVKFNITYRNCLNLLNIIPNILIIGYGGILIIYGEMTIGTLIALSTYVGKLFSPIMQLLENNSEIQKARVSLQRYSQFIDLQVEDEIKNNVDCEIDRISMKDVSFSYAEDADGIIDKLNVNLNKGDCVKLVGSNGAGKSTLIDIIIGLLEPSQGELSINNAKRNSSSIEAFSPKVGIVPQKGYMFNGTIYDNITLGKDIHVDEISKLVKAIGFMDLFDENNLTLETEIKNNGSNISGGQMQKISILRCFINTPDIIILDEVGTYLDMGTKERLLSYIKKMNNKIVINITHSEDFELEYSKIINLDKKEEQVVSVQSLAKLS